MNTKLVMAAGNKVSLLDKLGAETVVWLNAYNKKRLIYIIYHEPKGAHIVLGSGEIVLAEGLSKDETTKLFLYLGFVGRGKDGYETPAFAPFLNRCYIPHKIKKS